MPFRIYEALSSTNNLKIVKDYKAEGVRKVCESNNKSILGEIEGIFFVPDGVSANERFYSRKFWEHVLATEDVKNKLSRKIMFGRVGHEDRDVEEDDINSGKISHVVDKLWIDEQGRGMGHAIILDTPAGHNLYTCMAAGSDLRVSSRASGDYKTDEYYNGNIPVMDESVYVLDTFDMVIHPGFIETNPKLVAENYPKKQKAEHTVKKHESTKSEKRRQTMPRAKSERASLIAKAKSRIALAEKRALKAEESLSKSEIRYKNLLEKAKKISAELKQYKAEGKVADIKKVKAELNSFKQVAKSSKALKETLGRVKKSLTTAKSFKAEAEQGRCYKATLEKAKPVLAAYVSIGSLPEVKSKMAKLEAERKEQAKKAIAEKVQSYSRKTGLTREAIRKIFQGSKDYASAIAVLESLPAKSNDLYNKKNESAGKKPAAKKASEKNLFASGQGSVAKRLVESKCKKLTELHNDVTSDAEGLN